MPADRPSGPLSNKTALITGGAKRIGREIALTLAKGGANVAITYRESSADASTTVIAIQERGVDAIAIQLDLRNESSVKEAVGATVAKFGSLDLLINNVGVFESAALDQITLEQWDRVLETNTRGPFLMAREALHHLRASGGRIVNLGSLGGMHPWPTHAHYCVSKAGLHMLTQTMARDFAPDVSVNCVAPGYISFDNAGTAAEHFANKTPMARNGTARDVAEAVLFFATGPKFITGQILAVDGGLGLQ